MEDFEYGDYTEEDKVVEVIAKNSAYRRVLENKHVFYIREILQTEDSYSNIDNLIKKIDKTPDIKDGKLLYKNYLLEKKRLFAKNSIVKDLQNDNLLNIVNDAVKNKAICKEEKEVYTTTNDYSLHILNGYYDKAKTSIKENNLNKKEAYKYEKVIYINMRGRIIRLVFNEISRGCYAKATGYMPEVLGEEYRNYLSREERESYIQFIQGLNELWKLDERERQFFSSLNDGDTEKAEEILYLALGNKDLELSRNQFKELKEIIKTRNSKEGSYNNFVTNFFAIRNKAIEEESFT